VHIDLTATEHLTGQTIFERFQVEECVGHGGSSRVYRAVDLLTNELVAVKILTHSPGEDPQAPSQEAALLGRLSHPGVVRLIASGRLEPHHEEVLVIEWLDGHTVRAEHAVDPLTLQRVLALGALVARALHAMHNEGIVHRDIKPDNIVLRRPPSHDPLSQKLGADPVLIDLGLASVGRVTQVGGTAGYISPEQARGQTDVDERSDIYSLGATLFELISGSPPHLGQSAVATLAKTATTRAPRLSLACPGIGPRLDNLIDELLRTDPNERPRRALEVAERLEECLTSDAMSTYPTEDRVSVVPPSVSRLVTTLVATDVAHPENALRLLETHGAFRTPLGSDAVVGHWGALRATGDEARAAAIAALELRALGASVGVATGRARLWSGADQVHPVGEVVERAATLAREAGPGNALVDSTTSELGRGQFDFRVRDDGSAYLEHRSAVGRARRPGSPFVGREAEIARIIDAYENASSDQRGLTVFLCGPPGIGKSRLQREIVARLSGRPNAPRVVVQRNDAYGQKHILGAAADVLRGVIRLGKGSEVEEAIAAIVERVGPETLSEFSDESQRLLGQLLANEQLTHVLNQDALRDALWLSMTDVVTRILQNEPILLVLEDLQWADEESIQWLDHLSSRSTTRPLFILACVRPSYFQNPLQRLSGSHVLRVDLRPISRSSAETMVRSILGTDAPQELQERIVEKGGGSPLFTEELARLVASGQKDLDAPTIEAAIQASLDGLSFSCRAALARASVFGQAVWREALVALGVADVDAILEELLDQEVLMVQESSRFSETKEYLFKHALVRDVAYSELPEEERRSLHTLAGQWLGQRGEDAATVGGHFDLADHPEQASPYWETASRRALSANALGDALWMAEKSLAFATGAEETFRRGNLLDEVWTRKDPRSAERETAIRAMESSAYDARTRVRARGARARYEDARGGGAEILRELDLVAAEAERLGDYSEVDKLLAVIAARAAFALNLELAEAKVKALLDPNRPHGPSAEVDAFQALAVIRQAQGAVAQALEARKSAAAAARKAGLKEREATLTTNLGFALSLLGAKQDARDALERGLALADSIGSTGATRHTQMNLLGYSALYGSDRRLDGILAEVRALGDGAALDRWSSSDRSNLGVLYYRGVELLRSDSTSLWQQAYTLLSRATTQYRLLAHNDVLPVALGNWAEAARRLGMRDRALELAQEAASLIEAGAPSLLNEAPIFLGLYRIHQDLSNSAEADGALRRGMVPLERRFSALAGTPYARSFLTALPENSELVALADTIGILPAKIQAALSG
jgi:eukaryotic-like serine/threonine-protein kinase